MRERPATVPAGPAHTLFWCTQHDSNVLHLPQELAATFNGAFSVGRLGGRAISELEPEPCGNFLRFRSFHVVGIIGEAP